MKWLPKTKDGKISLVLCAVAIVYGILMPVMLPFWGRFADGRVVVSLEIILSIAAFYFSFKTIFKIKDRTILTIIAFSMLCLIGGFWLLFALGEVVFPH